MAACTTCGSDLPDGAKFCSECGSATSPPGGCPSCGTVNPGGAKFCLECGTPLASQPPSASPQEVRKVVTTVFSDLKGSTALTERLDSEAMREVMSRYFDVMSAELTRHGGTVEKFIGDAIMAVFGLPTLHEDDALRAVRAASGMQEALEELNDELDRVYGVRLVNRTGVNTGEVVAAAGHTDQRLVTGDVVNVAARLEQAAGACEVLLGELTYRLVRDHVHVEEVEPLELKGKSERVAAYRLLGLAEREDDAGRAAPMVGRDAELGRLEELLADAITTRRCLLATVVAEAGAGKTRLLQELSRRHRATAQFLTGRCLSYGDGITFWPLSEIVRSAADVKHEDDAETALGRIRALAGPDSEAVVERVASAIGLRPAPFAVDEIVWATRTLVQRLAAERPLVLVFEDIHWAEPAFLHLLDHLVDDVENAPVLLVCPARPSLLESRPAWAERHSGSRIVLERLHADAAAEMVRNLLGGSPLAQDVIDQIVPAAQGNPLFVEQLLSMLVDDGTIARVGEAWEVVGAVDQLTVPPTIQALLAARLDALAGDEREVIQPASVVGYVFAEDAVRHLAAEPVQPAVPRILTTLARKQLVQAQDQADDTYRFEHILIRDTTYDGILKRSRAGLHERFVEWADEVNGDRATEFEEILGYHLEQACRYLSELGPLDAHGRALGADGARRLASAGRRAFERGDAAAAASLLGRAAALLANEEPARLALLPDQIEALIQVGELEQARAIAVEGTERAVSIGDDVDAAKLRLVGLLAELRAGLEAGWHERVEAETSAALELFDRVGDHEGAAKAWRLRGWSSGIACRFADTAYAAEQTLEHARRANDVRQARRSISSYGTAMVFGPTPVDEALERCEQLLDEAHGDRSTEGWLLARLASLHTLREEIPRARDLNERAIAMLRELKLETDVVFLEVEAWRTEMVGGDLDAAERLLRHGYDHLVAIGERYLLSTVAGLLAQTLYELGRLDETSALADLTEELAADDDIDTQALWRCVRAKLWSAEGRHDEAIALVRDALTVLEPTDAVLLQSATLIDLAVVLGAAGRDEDRLAALARARELAAAKGDLATVGLVERLAAAPVAASTGQPPP